MAASALISNPSLSPAALMRSSGTSSCLSCLPPWRVRQPQKRLYATPVNPSSSVDVFLGIATPPPPRPAERRSERSVEMDVLASTSRRGSASASGAGSPDRQRKPIENTPSPEDELAHILEGGKPSAASSHRLLSGRPFTREGMSESRRSAILAELKGTTISSDQKRRGAPHMSHYSPPPPPESAAGGRDKGMPVDREHPHAIDEMQGRNKLHERILQAARALYHHRIRIRSHSRSNPTQHAADLPSLLTQFEQRAYHQLGIELPYEPTPSHARRVPLTSCSSSNEDLERAGDDGVLLVAYVFGGLAAGPSSAAENAQPPRLPARGTVSITVCSGFAVQGGERMQDYDNGQGKGALMVTCAHTLRDSASSLLQRWDAQRAHVQNASPYEGEEEDKEGVAFAITRTGHIYPIVTLVSSLPNAGLVLCQLAEQPLSVSKVDGIARQVFQQQQEQLEQPSGIRTLPLCPYPATVGSEVAVSSSRGFEDDSGTILPAWYFDPCPPSSSNSRSSLRIDPARSRWGRARLVTYKTPLGEEAHTGTYDSLHSAEFQLLETSSHNPPALQNLTLSGAANAPAGGTGDGSSSAGAAGTLARENSTRGQALLADSAFSSCGRKRLPSFPPRGSSGGPVVDVKTGSIVGVVRGTKMSVLEGKRGDAIPAEKVFEFFALPGFGDPGRK